jgi:N-sulfoglucosamine sulfohydrolase
MPNLSRREWALGAAASLSAAQANRPNILVILSDDHSVPLVGCYGNKTIQTPNLDSFAASGMRFDKAFTAAPQCVPSRTAIMTGRSPVAARMGRFSSPLPPDVLTLPEHLRKAGYFTGICRRQFHLDGSPPFYKTLDRLEMRTFDSRVDWLDRNSGRDQTEAKFNEFLDKKPAGKPFFLWMNFNDPHHVWDKTGQHDPKSVWLPPWLPDSPGMRDDLARYYDEVGRMDGEFASVMGILAKRGFAENTLVVFMGDNGMAFPHGKGSLYDPGLHVPLMVRWPGRVKPGTSTADLVSGEDISPTLLAAAGLAKPKEMSGRSFLGRLTGAPGYQPRETIFAARLAHGNGMYNENASTFDLSRCIRSTGWKLIYNCTPHQRYGPVDSARDAGWREMKQAHDDKTLNAAMDKAYFAWPRPVFELYDLERDPNEMNNLAGRPEHAAIELQLKEAMRDKMILDYDFLPLPMAQ